MIKINTLLVDDEQEALDTLEILLSEYPQINIIEKTSNPIDVFSVLMTKKIDLIFLDIKMPLINGIDLLEKIRECNPLVEVVIVTAYDNYAIKAIKHNAFTYLLKPVSRVELQSTVEHLQKSFEARCKNNYCNKVLITSKGNTVIVEFNNVVYLEAEGNYTHVFLKNGSKVVASSNMGMLIGKFPDNIFVKINRSIMVNKDCLLSINKKNKTCLVKVDAGEIRFTASVTFLREFNSIFSNA